MKAHKIHRQMIPVALPGNHVNSELDHAFLKAFKAILRTALLYRGGWQQISHLSTDSNVVYYSQ